MNNTYRDEWERFLNPEVLRTNLMLASIYIASYEILKDSIIKPIKDFYVNGFKGDDYSIDPKYKSEVLNRNKSELYASLEWLKESKVITEDDMTLFEQAKNAAIMLPMKFLVC